MSTHLDAGFVYASDEHGVIMVGFADRQYGTRRYVLLQRAREVADDERARGEDAVHLELDGQERSVYGAIESVEVRRTTVRIVLRAEKAVELETDRQVQVSFALDDREYFALVQALRALWEHQPSALVIHSI